jgi:hypothetical protein
LQVTDKEVTRDKKKKRNVWMDVMERLHVPFLHPLKGLEKEYFPSHHAAIFFL